MLSSGPVLKVLNNSLTSVRLLNTKPAISNLCTTDTVMGHRSASASQKLVQDTL